jgi:broad specificity phosphatase PhoE
LPRHVVHYLTHPQVGIDPAVEVPRWPLSDLGRARAARLAATRWARRLERIVSSAERKAVETAEFLARACGAAVEIGADLHENDRSATGYLPAAEFETLAEAVFAEPEASVRGWERAVDAQSRIVAAVAGALGPAGRPGVCLVGHGAVGTLLLCHLAARPIARRHDQTGGGGNLFAFTWPDGRLVHDWRALETFR